MERREQNIFWISHYKDRSICLNLSSRPKNPKKSSVFFSNNLFNELHQNSVKIWEFWTYEFSHEFVSITIFTKKLLSSVYYMNKFSCLLLVLHSVLHLTPHQMHHTWILHWVFMIAIKHTRRLQRKSGFKKSFLLSYKNHL